MKKAYEDFIYLIRCVLAGESAQDFSCENFGELFHIAKDHSMSNMLYYALRHNKNVPKKIAEELSELHNLIVYKSANQRVAERELRKLMSESGIRHIFLKGFTVNGLYPSGDMREMSDIDILVDAYDLERVNRLLTSNGYKFDGHKGHHDVYSKEPLVSVEIHETALDHNRKTGLDEYFSDAWSIAESDGAEYKFNVIDNYIFLMGHLFGHFKEGGTGVRTVTDIGLYLKEYKDVMDWTYINEVFKKYDVLEAMNNIADLASAWFGDGEKTELLDEMGEYVFGSGSYGKASNMMMSIADENGGKAGSIIKSVKRKLFIPAAEMRRRSKIIDKCPILLPFAYVCRVFKILFGQFNELKWWMNGARKADVQAIKKHKEKMRRFGVH